MHDYQNYLELNHRQKCDNHIDEDVERQRNLSKNQLPLFYISASWMNQVTAESF